MDMTLVHRVLTPEPIANFDEYLARGGGVGWENALGMSPEAIVGRHPFPRVSPPFRRGVVEVVDEPDEAVRDDNDAAALELAPGTEAPPTLVDNIETMANVPRIIERGATWFRTDGTEKSPGTLVVTITGAVKQAAVGEVLMGTTLRAAIEEIGGGARRGHRIK